MDSKEIKHSFLQGGGDMGKLIRAKDWSSTPLGNPTSWPQSLRTMVSVLLDNPFGMYIAWGKEYTQIYNDGYRPILGANKHPQALGISTKETFSEIWHIIESMFDDVMNGVAVGFPDFMLPLDRNGFVESCYFDFAYSPIRMDNGEVGGVLVTVIETTNKKKAEDELKESKNQLEFVLEAAQLGTFDYNPFTNKFQGNTRLKNWFGLPPDEQIELTDAINAIASKDSERVTNAIKNVLDPNSNGVYDVEYSIIHPITKKETIVHAKGKAWFNEDKIAYRLNGTLEDVTERVVARRKIEENEAQLRAQKQLYEAVMTTTPDLIYVFDLHCRFSYANDAVLKMWGVSWETAQGKSLLELGYEQWHAEMHEQEIAQVINTKEPIRGQVSFPHATLGNRIYDYIFAPILDNNGNVEAIAGSTRDITEIKQAEEHFRQMAEQMPQKIWTADMLGNRDYFNQVTLNYTGLSFEELKDWGWKRIIHPDDWPQTKNLWEQSINSGNDFENENRLRRKDGKYLWHIVRATPVKDSQGNIKMWIGSNTEIQDQVALAETLVENLKESDKRIQTILQNAPDAVITIDEKGIIQSWNAESENIFGWNSEEAVGKTLTQTIIPERYRKGHDNGMKHYLQTGHGPVMNRAIELSATKKNGLEIPIELKISSTKTKDRHTFIGFIRDISVRKEAQHELENKTTQLIEAQELAHIGSWEWDVEKNKITWSDELYRIFDLRPQLFNPDYDSYIKYIHPDDREFVNDVVQRAFVDQQPFTFFHRTLSEDGKVRVINGTGKVFTNDSGNVIKMSGTAQDVTEQKTYEEELRISEERFYKIFNSNPIPMTLSEIGSNKIMFANTMFYDVFGYSKDEVIGNSSEDLNLMDTEEYQRVVNLILDYLHENRSLEEIQSLTIEETESLLQKLKHSEKMKGFEILYTKKDGHKFPAVVSFELIKMGAESYTVTSYQDISERKKAEELLKTQNEQLEKMNKELESFVYVSSHDLQEPLRKIQTFVSQIMVNESAKLEGNLGEKFRRIQNAALRMQILIQDLLAYSRTSTHERILEKVSLEKIISEVQEDLKEELEAKNATIEIGTMLEITLIPFQFHQLLYNLLSNSLKFSRKGIPPHIKISSKIVKGSTGNESGLDEDLTYYNINISDNGIGFEQQYSNKIFVVFQRLHGRETYEGTGVGLAIVKKIVENHNGIITATGKPNKGATFDIYIPT